MRSYNLIKMLLQSNPALRDSDRLLIWEVWLSEGSATSDVLTKDNFLHRCKSPETIRRTRQKIQEKHPELQSSAPIRGAKAKIEAQKGTHIYRDNITFDPKKNIAIEVTGNTQEKLPLPESYYRKRWED